MQIKKGKYILNSDKSCYWVSEIKTRGKIYPCKPDIFEQTYEEETE